MFLHLFKFILPEIKCIEIRREKFVSERFWLNGLAAFGLKVTCDPFNEFRGSPIRHLNHFGMVEHPEEITDLWD